MTPHSVVTTPRHLTGVVTEFCLADLRGPTVQERVQSLTGVAHSHGRDELSVAVESLGL